MGSPLYHGFLCMAILIWDGKGDFKMKRKVIGLFTVMCILLSVSGMLFAADKDGKINLNTATKDQLLSIGIDPEIADEILEHKKENGEFVDIEELLDVEGVTPALLRQLKQKLYIEATAGCNC
jgi:competence protein ComEA